MGLDIDNSGKKQIQKELVKIGLFTLRTAKQKAPVDTGRLRSSLTVADSEGIIQNVGPNAETEDGVNTPNKPFSVLVGTNLEYAKFVEFGTVNQSPQPFLRPALDQAKTRFDLNQ